MLADWAYEALKLEDSSLSIERVDKMTAAIPESLRRSELKIEAWDAMVAYIATNLPFDYQMQVSPHCAECVRQAATSMPPLLRRVHILVLVVPRSTWAEREEFRQNREVERE